MRVDKRLLTITIPIEAWAKTGTDILLDSVPECLSKNEYEDGRYPFCHEQFQAGLTEMLRNAVRHEVFRFMKRKHGKAKAPVGLTVGGTEAATYYTDEYMKNDFAGVVVDLEGLKATTSEIRD